jgi:hypothetical protein
MKSKEGSGATQQCHSQSYPESLSGDFTLIKSLSH